MNAKVDEYQFQDRLLKMEGLAEITTNGLGHIVQILNYEGTVQSQFAAHCLDLLLGRASASKKEPYRIARDYVHDSEDNYRDTDKNWNRQYKPS